MGALAAARARAAVRGVSARQPGAASRRVGRSRVTVAVKAAGGGSGDDGEVSVPEGVLREGELAELFERLASAQPEAHAAAALGSRAPADKFFFSAAAAGGSGGGGLRDASVWLVGTGPGDPELLTLKALRIMQSADVVLYDRLVSPEILRMVHAGARMVYVGKASGQHTRTQEEIHTLLGHFAASGQTIVRLKGGDPFVFGRGGEEMEYLAARGLEINCVPGVTAAAGICAALGIPQTHRGVATSVRFLTGHTRADGDNPGELAARHADPDTTTCVYMGLQTLPELVAAMMGGGLGAETPAVAVERGTTPQQRTVFSTLGKLPERVAGAGLVSPTLVVVGNVVALSPLWARWCERGDVGVSEALAEAATLPGAAVFPAASKEGAQRPGRSPA